MLIHTLGNEIRDLIPVFAMAIGGAIAVIWIIMATIDSTVKAKAREQTRRELAAYVAEGSMSASDAAQIMNAGKGGKNAAARADEFASAAKRA